MKPAMVAAVLALPAALPAQSPPTLPAVTVHSERVANQSPAMAIATPGSALRYEPLVDLQSRNLAEGQADVTLRGGIFENSAFQLGAATLWDPQTGHYFAELPVSPTLLTPPRIETGAELAAGPVNATSGAVAYGWRPVRTGGAASIGAGQHQSFRGEIYHGYGDGPALAGGRLGADFALARSQSDGPIAFGEHTFSRLNGRLQLAGKSAQTDLFAGYQEKSFGWPNLYTPFNSNETENLQTVLFALNHRRDLGADGFFEAGGFHRRNKDDYAFNRFAPVAPIHPFQHTTWTSGVAAGGRQVTADFAVNYRAEVLADELRSTSLTFGHFRTRTMTKLSLVPERTWTAGDGGRYSLKAGAVYDDTNRDSSAVSPLIEIARETGSSALQRVQLSYSEATQVPTYTALNSSATAGLFRGNADLGRQRSRNLEAGFRGSFAGWTGRAALFWRRDLGLVDWTFRRGTTARTANAVNTDVAGFEAFARHSTKFADLVLGYTLLTKDADYRGAPVDASFYALNYARHRLTLAFTLRLGHGFELRMDNAARIQADNLLRVVGGDEAVTSSAALAYHPPAWKRCEVSFQVENLWNSRFQEIPAVPATPRQTALGFTTTW